MRRSLLHWVSVFALLLISANAQAKIFPSGVDSGRTPATSLPHVPASTCYVLWFGTDTGDEIARITGLGMVVTHTTNPADVNAGNLANYNVLVVAYTGAGVLGGNQADIQSFVNSGGALLIHQPNVSNAVLDYTPAGFGVAITSNAWCNFPDPGSAQGHIVTNAHPITSSLTDADLSGAFDLVGSIGPGYTLLAINAACLDPSLAACNFGSGRVVFEDGNVNTAAFIPGSDHYWSSVFDWLCNGNGTPTHPVTWGQLKSSYR